jgi:heterodisulfide reductase subunit A
LERVVIASCTPRTHEPLFKNAVKEGGLNPYLMEFVSLREQSSWVHTSVPEEATEKAKDLVRMGVAKARFLEPAEEIRVPVGKTCLVVGGGIAGMTAALSVAAHGFEVHLVEREEHLGGNLNRLDMLAPMDREARQLVKTKSAEVDSNDKIHVHIGTEVEAVDGYVGNYKVKLKGRSTDALDISQIIVATGMREIEPEGRFGYGDYPNVVTLLRFERMLQTPGALKGKSVGIIHCVGSRDRQRGCCNVGCLASIRSAKSLKELEPGSRVYLFYRDLNVQGTDVDYAQKSLAEHDIRAVRYSPKSPPEVTGERDGGLLVKTRDVLLGEEIEVPVDLLVLVTGLQGDGSVDDLKGFLKVSTGKDGFFHEAHIKLAPLDFPTDGVYVCGGARSPKSVRSTMEESIGAAMRASIPMKRGFVESPGIVSKIDLDACVYCGVCGNVCAFGALEIEHESKKKHVPRVVEALCKGCGTCAAECPVDAIQIVHYSDAQVEAQVDAALAENPEEKIVAFCCHWCAMGAVDLAGVNRAEYPTPARIIRVMCAGRVDTDWVRRALDLGAAGVLVAGCEFPTCHYINGNRQCRNRMNKLKKKLARKGYDVDRVWNVWMSAADAPKFVATMKEMTRALGLG